MTTHKTKEIKKDIGATRAFLEKIVINAGVGRASQISGFEEKIMPQIIRDIGILAGQRPQVRRSRKSIAGFKMREGQIVGIRVTLRGQRMVDFFERLIRIVLPRVRDFNGIPLSGVDDGGALNIGLREQYVFSEISPEESPFSFAFQINVVPRRKDRASALATYRNWGVPLKKK
ncbi:MAG: 50S ribosomal protein L5 [Candidatus Liptonbacteria bacterium]|nr:50S ribosomal protein L5 [Candidatus Liptonbacteria bacterium]